MNVSLDKQAPPRAIEIAIVLISVAMLMFQILQTLTLSLQTLERNAFLVVSMCLLGLGAGGSLATLMGRRISLSPISVMWGSAFAFAVAMVLSMMISSWTLDMRYLIVLGVAPYIFAGVFLSFVFRTWPEYANRLYFLNLMGSGLGCLGLVAIVNGTGDAAMTLAVVAAVALIAVSLVGRVMSRARQVVPLVIILVVVAVMPMRDDLFRFRPAADKGMGAIMYDDRIESEIVWSRWGYLGRLDVLDPGEGIEHFALGGVSVQRMQDNGCDVKYLFAAGGNWTKAIDFRGHPERRKAFVDKTRHSLPYIVTKPTDVLNIGFGGGVDVFLALRHRAESIVGVDINPLMVKAGREYLSGYFDDFYNNPKVEIEIMDGRTYVRNTDRKFDVVSLTAVDTGELLHSNAHVLLENYLYTQEAFDDYLNVLKPEGALYVSRPKIQTLRALATAVQALRNLDVAEPQKHICVIGDGEIGRGRWRSAIITREPLRPWQIKRIKERYAKRVAYLPIAGRWDPELAGFLDAVRRGEEETFLAAATMDFSPVVDDRPFFYEFDRDFGKSDAVHLLTRVLKWVLIIGGALIVLPLLLVPLPEKKLLPRLISTMGYFAAIGIAFMLIEICLIQRLVLFLGHPSYSVTVTLFSILIFSGLGSMFSQRFKVFDLRTPLYIWGPLCLGVLFYVGGLDPLLKLVSKGPMAVRVVMTALVLAPTSFFMGMPFPTMIRVMGRGDNMLIPWAWAVNAFTSVAASVLAVLFAMRMGFSVVFYIGAAFYVVALLFFLMRTRVGKNTESVQPAA